jgi:hypothetical protein
MYMIIADYKQNWYLNLPAHRAGLPGEDASLFVFDSPP